LLALFAQQVQSARQTSVTVDEPIHLTRGYVYLRLHDLRFRLGHPLGMNAWNALPLLLLDDVTLPTGHPSWAAADWPVFDEQFFWQAGNDVTRMVALARLPTMFLALVVAAVVYRWAADLYGPRAGLLALLLCAFSPNFVAHSRLVTTDLGQTAGFFLTVFLFWRFLRHPTWPLLALTGFALGLAQTTKFSALFLLPALGLIALLRLLVSDPQATVWRFPANGPLWRRARDLAGALAVIGLLGLVALWAVYGLELRPALGLSVPIPAATHWEELVWVMDYFNQPHPAYLNGQFSDFGWWYYFPVTFALKTPLPLLLFVGWGAIAALRKGRWQRVYPLLAPLAVYWAASLISTLNIGHRHLLPTLPFLFVLAAGALPIARANKPHAMRRAPYALCAVLLVWYVLGTLRIYPHYLAYFNELAGGPDGGWRYLADSNIDWGQDLGNLAAYVRDSGQEDLYLSWFGVAAPDYYGLSAQVLPGWPFITEDSAHRVFYPANPAPGRYAISVNNLLGLYLPRRDTFAWFRERQPVDKVGYSIFIYDVPRTDQSQWAVVACLSDLSISDIDAETFEQAFGTNDVTVRWFDARGALLLPGGGRDAWYLLADTRPLDPALGERFLAGLVPWDQGQAAGSGKSYALYRLPASDVARLSAPAADAPVWWSAAMTFPPADYEWHLLSLPVEFNGRLAFLGYELAADSLHPGDELRLLTFWRVEQSFEPPLSLFVHLLDAQGAIIGQHDGLAADPVGLVAGDVFVQVHRFPVPSDAPPGEYPLEIGVYRPDSGQRWNVPLEGVGAADRLLLRPVSVEAR